MSKDDPDTSTTRVIVVAPFRRDAEFVEHALETPELSRTHLIRASDKEDLPRFDEDEASLLIVTQDALTVPFLDRLSEWLSTQPNWFQPPVILLIDSTFAQSPHLATIRKRLGEGHVTFLFRPCYVLEFRSVVRKSLALVEQQRSVRELLEAERRFRAETDHRMKNQLSTVLALYHLSRRQSTTLEEFDDSFGRRIQSLGDVHDLLRQSGDMTVDFHELCHALLAPFQDDGAERISVLGPSFATESEAALALSLMLNELATNAAKYGAFVNIAGTVAIRTAKMIDNAIEVTWTEDGGPAVRAPQKTSYGTSFINSAARMLGGRASIDYPEAGVVVTFSVDSKKVVNPHAAGPL